MLHDHVRCLGRLASRWVPCVLLLHAGGRAVRLLAARAREALLTAAPTGSQNQEPVHPTEPVRIRVQAARGRRARSDARGHRARGRHTFLGLPRPTLARWHREAWLRRCARRTKRRWTCRASRKSKRWCPNSAGDSWALPAGFRGSYWALVAKRGDTSGDGQVDATGSMVRRYTSQPALVSTA